ncbi:hypothetical protein [Amphiplicatus metriothermophilus]|uniref:hypothetical protein n=1 Tax=Amphiplicatus metriothermophilus TaxID=1519374 RepID=UPI0016063DF6|nr:hypothetical protein [Amphiplicatus metriothermophilus]MBB5517917.1 hypothetical protein [Amphiplicatus metriothermophilus]
MPPPEPVEELLTARRAIRREAEAEAAPSARARRDPPETVKAAPVEEDARDPEIATLARGQVDDLETGSEDDDRLFFDLDEPESAPDVESSRAQARKPSPTQASRAPSQDRRGDGRGAARFGGHDRPGEEEMRSSASSADGHDDEVRADSRDWRPWRAARAPKEPDHKRAPALDAYFEDVGGEESPGGFGRRSDRRGTALARIEDLEPIAERVFNEEFFAALRVQPRALERAIRKARRRAEARAKNRLTPMRALGWAAWLGAVGATAFVVYSYRDAIVARWPEAAGAYAVIGVEANPYGLAIEGVAHRLAMSTGGPTIEITGRLRNDTDAPVTAPLMQAEALGPRGELLARWTFAVEREVVPAGERAAFMTRAPAPDGVAEVALTFAPASRAPRAAAEDGEARGDPPAQESEEDGAARRIPF